MAHKITIEQIEEKINLAGSRTELAQILGVSKQYLDFFLKKNGLKIDSSLHFKINEGK